MISKYSVLFACFLVLSACGGGSSTAANPTPPAVNNAPVVNAGLDATIRLPSDTADLDATVSDDGLPAGAVLSTAWSVQSGPAGATFGDVNGVDTTVTFVSEGTYVLELTADDTARQTSDTVTVTVEAAPVLTDVVVAPSTAALTSGATQQFVASGTDQYGAVFPVVATWSATGGTIDATGLYTAGPLAGAFVVTATDGSVSNTASVTISSSPPTADAGGPYAGVEGSAVALDGSGSTDANNDITDYDWDLDNDGAYDDAVGANPTFMSAGPGVFTIGLRVTDADGAASVDTTTVTVSNVAPVANDQSVSTGEDTPVAIMLTGSDPGITPLAFTIASQPSNGVLSGAAPNVTYTPNSNYNGSDSFTFTVNDGTVDSLAATVSITVGAANDAPVLDPIGNQLVDELTLLTFTATATDADLPANGLTFTLGGTVPTGAAITAGGAFTWTPTEAQGGQDYTFDVVVTDDGTGLLSDSETITVTVVEANVAPVLDAIGDQSVDELNLLSFTATATDADLPADGLTFSLGGTVPAGAAITAGGAFTWTPTEAQGGQDYTFNVVVTDNGVGLMSDSETITVTVGEVNVAPALDPIGDKSVDEEATLTFTATATDADLPANTLTFTLVNGASGSVPPGAAITAGGDFTWSPTAPQGPNSYTFDVVVTDAGTLSDSETITVTVNAIDAYWTFDTGTGVTAFDTVGNSDGTIFGGNIWTAGVSGLGADFALDLDGSTGYVDVADTEALNITGTSITMTAWIYPRDGGDSNGSRVISKMNNAGNGDVIAMFTNEYRLRFRLDDVDMISSHILELNEWVHVAMVYDGTDKRIYINGTLEEDLQNNPLTQAKSDPIDASTNSVQLGRSERAGGSRFFNGIIDEVHIFKRALIPGEVAAIAAVPVTPVDPAPGGLSFSDITASAGVSGPARGGHGVMFAEVTGPGLVNDSRPDYYLTNNLENTANRSEFYFDNTNGAVFAELQDSLGAVVANAIADIDGGSHGAVWADLDNDGDYDLVNGTTWDNVTPVRGNPAPDNIFRNNAVISSDPVSFTDVTPASLLPPNLIIETRGLTAFDMDGDGDLDLFGVPGSQSPGFNEAFLNDGSFGFTAHVGGALSTTTAMQGVTDTDYDGDGDIDVLAGNRAGEFAILKNDGTGIFTKVLPAALGIAGQAGDGITTADIDNDGDLDLLLVSDGTASIWRRVKTAAEEVIDPSNTYESSQSFSSVEGYMGGFADLDNNGFQDLVFAGDESVFMNDGSGTFTPGQSVPVSEISDPRAIAFADINGDGDLDFAIAAKGSRNWLVSNDIDADAGNWLSVRLVSPSGQAGAFGAKVSVVPAGGGTLIGMREAKGNHGYLAQDNPVLHFGLGANLLVDVTVDFVDGTQTVCSAQAANQRIVISGAVCNPP